MATASKMRFVLALVSGDADAAGRLNRSVHLEIAFVALILIVTAVLTSAITLPEA